VKITYGEILENPNASEQERVSCVMQIFNKHQSWKPSEIVDYVALHNKWKDYNPEITRKKIEEYVLPKYKNKENPITPEPDEFIESKGVVNFYQIKKELQDSHKHLRLFDTVDKSLGLEGEKYYSIKKWLSYFYESNIQKPIKITVGSACYDNRIHGLVVATAGKGKGVIKNAVKKSFKFETNDVMEASGLVHPEQLIGKIKYVGRGKERHPIEAKGYLSSGILLHDEANTTINELAPNSDQSMRVKRSAMDCYEYNQISKKLVDDLIKDTLEYYPVVRCIDFMHPEQFSNCFFDKGTYRRYCCFELGNNKQLDLNDSIKSIMEETTNYEEQQTLIQGLKYEAQSVNDLQFNDDCKQLVGKWILLWNGFVLNHDHPSVRRFGEMTFYSIKDYFFKFITILHGAYKKEISEPALVHLACIDTIHFLLDTLENYSKYGDLANTSDVWRGAKGMEIRALEYLWRKEATSYEKSNVSIQSFLDLIGELFGVQERQARGIFSNLKSKSYVSSKQVGKNGSRVWICFEPEINKVVLGDFSLEEFWGKTYEGGKGGNVFSHIGLTSSIKAYSIHASTQLLNKKNNYNKEESTKQANISDLTNYNKEEVVVGFVNNQVLGDVCLPCHPEPPHTSTNIEPDVCVQSGCYEVGVEQRGGFWLCKKHLEVYDKHKRACLET